MIIVDKIDVWGFEHAIRGMRNPLNSWEKSDTRWCGDWDCDPDGSCRFRSTAVTVPPGGCVLGDADGALMNRLFKAGPEHRKFMRQIFVSMDITAPLYWWKEFDTYKVGTTANSCSTMHRIADKAFTADDFSHEHLLEGSLVVLGETIDLLNDVRELFLQTKDKKYWWQMIQLLPSSYNQKRTVTMNYENAASMIKQRSGHKLDEWNDFVEHLENLPYMDVIINGGLGRTKRTCKCYTKGR